MGKPCRMGKAAVHFWSNVLTWNSAHAFLGRYWVSRSSLGEGKYFCLRDIYLGIVEAIFPNAFGPITCVVSIFRQPNGLLDTNKVSSCPINAKIVLHINSAIRCRFPHSTKPASIFSLCPSLKTYGKMLFSWALLATASVRVHAPGLCHSDSVGGE